MAKHFRVRNLMGEIVAEGTVKECAAALEMKPSGFQAAVERARNGVQNHRYVIEELKTASPAIDYKTQRAQERWDAFVIPIRKKYGIPVYRPGKGAGR